MDKKQLLNSEMLQILARILYDEYLEVQKRIRVLSHESVQNRIQQVAPFTSGGKSGIIESVKWFQNWDIGKENDQLKGFFIVPELMYYENFVHGEANFRDIKDILQSDGLYNFFKYSPKEQATVIGEKGISCGLYLDSIPPAEKILEKNIDQIVQMYTSSLEKPGARTRSSIAAAALLNNQDLLEKKLGITPDQKKPDNSSEESKFYDGNIYCKRETIVNYTFTGAIHTFSNSEIASADFCLQRVRDCSTGLINKYSKKGSLDKKYLFGRGVVGVLRIHKYNETEGKAVLSNEYLIGPKDFGIERRKIKLK